MSSNSYEAEIVLDFGLTELLSNFGSVIFYLWHWTIYLISKVASIQDDSYYSLLLAFIPLKGLLSQCIRIGLCDQWTTATGMGCHFQDL